jgi:predicted AAA+ superfamily ATPase
MKRAAEALLTEYLAAFSCLALLGLRQCGKTTLLHTLPKRRKHFDVERRADQAVMARDPGAFVRLNPRRVTLDEAELLPGIFPALRVAIDDHRAEQGRFVITCSSSPALTGAIAESLAGRVGIIELAPFPWAEVTDTIRRDSFVMRRSALRARGRFRFRRHLVAVTGDFPYF